MRLGRVSAPIPVSSTLLPQEMGSPHHGPVHLHTWIYAHERLHRLVHELVLEHEQSLPLDRPSVNDPVLQALFNRSQCRPIPDHPVLTILAPRDSPQAEDLLCDRPDPVVGVAIRRAVAAGYQTARAVGDDLDRPSQLAHHLLVAERREVRVGPGVDGYMILVGAEGCQELGRVLEDVRSDHEVRRVLRVVEQIRVKRITGTGEGTIIERKRDDARRRVDDVVCRVAYGIMSERCLYAQVNEHTVAPVGSSPSAYLARKLGASHRLALLQQRPTSSYRSCCRAHSG